MCGVWIAVLGLICTSFVCILVLVGIIYESAYGFGPYTHTHTTHMHTMSMTLMIIIVQNIYKAIVGYEY